MLRTEILHLAHTEPALRKHLVPLLKQAEAVPVLMPVNKPKIHRYVSLMNASGNETYLYVLSTGRYFYLLRIPAEGRVKILARGKDASILHAFDLTLRNYLTGIVDGAEYFVRDSKIDAHALEVIFTALPNLKDAMRRATNVAHPAFVPVLPDKKEEAEAIDFVQVLKNSLANWKIASVAFSPPRHPYWPVFQKRMLKEIKKKYGPTIHIWRGLRGIQAESILAGKTQFFKEFSSWATEKKNAEVFARTFEKTGTWVVLEAVVPAEQIAAAPVTLPGFIKPDVLMIMARDAEFEGEEVIVRAHGGKIRYKIVARSDKQDPAQQTPSPRSKKGPAF